MHITLGVLAVGHFRALGRVGLSSAFVKGKMLFQKWGLILYMFIDGAHVSHFYCGLKLNHMNPF